MKKEKLLKTLFRTTKYKGHKNIVNTKKTGFLKCVFKFKGESNYIEANNCVFYRCKFSFFGSNNKITIGSNCLFKNVEFWIEDNNNIIEIGNNSSFCGDAQIACLEGTKITIGSDFLCSSDVRFRTSDSHSILDADGKRINCSSNIIIGNKVWACQRVTFLKGAVVPDNNVVGYGAVVTKEFSEKNCVLGGIPSQVIKRNIDWSIEKVK